MRLYLGFGGMAYICLVETEWTFICVHGESSPLIVPSISSFTVAFIHISKPYILRFVRREPKVFSFGLQTCGRDDDLLLRLKVLLTATCYFGLKVLAICGAALKIMCQPAAGGRRSACGDVPKALLGCSPSSDDNQVLRDYG